MKRNGRKGLVTRAFVLGTVLLLALVSMSGCIEALRGFGGP